MEYGDLMVYDPCTAPTGSRGQIAPVPPLVSTNEKLDDVFGIRFPPSSNHKSHPQPLQPPIQENHILSIFIFIL